MKAGSSCRSVLFVAVVSVAANAASHAQQADSPPATDTNRQGNIVEYFGKEKVEEISEGKLLHVFSRGLVLPRTGSFDFAQSTSTPTDEVVARFLFGRSTGIETDLVFDVDYTGRPLKWEEIEADENSTFQDRRLQSGVLYLTYEAEEDQTVLLDASGHTSLLIDGLPHEGDHYDFGWNLIPLRLEQGKHEFVLQGGRFGRMRARLIAPDELIQFTKRDMTLPDVILEEDEDLLGAIRVINAKDEELSGARIECRLGKEAATSEAPVITGRHVRKVPFRIPSPSEQLKEGSQVDLEVKLVDADGQMLDSVRLQLYVQSRHKHHKRTFTSDIDGSVQYYAVAPSTDTKSSGQAMFLSVHGASVEATSQAAAYTQKEWGHLVAPTNRRPFGFAWEDWGRLDALEVLAHAEGVYNTDRSRTYLTGHSMGGHGTWYLGATYPDRWAAIAPCAGYPDLLGYRSGFLRQLNEMSDEMRTRFGITDTMVNRVKAAFESKSVFDEIVSRGGSPSRTLSLIDNYTQHGVYILHGENDTVVPTRMARMMRQRLGEFHADYVYYEYPNGSHWYGNHSVDWGPIFRFFEDRRIPASGDVERFTFSTASPGVSADCHFLKVVQQHAPFKVSTVEFERTEDSLVVNTQNVRAMTLSIDDMGVRDGQSFELDGQAVDLLPAGEMHLLNVDSRWEAAGSTRPLSEKGPHRNGGFKDAFRNRFVLVYATQGSENENRWYCNRARSDAEKFWYRANGNVEIVSDAAFKAGEYANRNVVIYGNRDNNSAWDELLKDCPLQFSDRKVTLGDVSLSGAGWGGYFVYPRPDSDSASVGVVTASGPAGMKAAYANHYLVNATCFPDVMVFDEHFLDRGIDSLKCAGFWGNQWDAETGDFVWK